MKLPEAYDYAIGTSKKIIEELGQSRFGLTGDTELGIFGEMIATAGSDPYLEIGVGFGASILMAAMVGERYGKNRKLYGIDIWKGTGINWPRQHSKSFYEAAREEARMYIDRFPSYPIQLIHANSQYLPLAKKRYFSCALIDGLHYGYAPLLDFINIEGLVKEYIYFHDYTAGAVYRAARFAVGHPCWAEEKSTKKCIVIRRVLQHEPR